jgi:hypothetical protein
MQVFMPYPCFIDSVGCLDTQRLRNQIVNEAYVISKGNWPNHPASKIWQPHLCALCHYCLAGLRELRARGAIRSESYRKWTWYYAGLAQRKRGYPSLPDLMGYPPYHAAMRSQLLRKAPSFYEKFGWSEPPGQLEYVWQLPMREISHAS